MERDGYMHVLLSGCQGGGKQGTNVLARSLRKKTYTNLYHYSSPTTENFSDHHTSSKSRLNLRKKQTKENDELNTL